MKMQLVKATQEEVHNAPCVVVSCGFSNLEFSSFSENETSVLSERLSGVPRRAQRGFPGDIMSCFRRSFEANFTRFRRAANGEGRRIYYLDCTKFYDPEDDKSLRYHPGLCPETKHKLSQSNYMDVLFKQFREFDPTVYNLIVCICRSGRHRAVGTADLTATAIASHFYESTAERVMVVHLQHEEQWGGLCEWGKCQRCDPTTRKNLELNEAAGDTVRGRLKQVTKEFRGMGASLACQLAQLHDEYLISTLYAAPPRLWDAADARREWLESKCAALKQKILKAAEPETKAMPKKRPVSDARRPVSGCILRPRSPRSSKRAKLDSQWDDKPGDSSLTGSMSSSRSSGSRVEWKPRRDSP